jgi:hypothetical protein
MKGRITRWVEELVLEAGKHQLLHQECHVGEPQEHEGSIPGGDSGERGREQTVSCIEQDDDEGSAGEKVVSVNTISMRSN